MKERTRNIIRTVATAVVITAILPGCCLFGCKEECCNKDKACCANRAAENCAQDCPKPKTSGANASVTLGVGTGGVSAGGAANLGSHGASGSVGGEMH